MRKVFCVQMIALLLVLTACNGTGKEYSTDLRSRYQEMRGCTMEAIVRCDQEGLEWESTLRCNYTPGEESSVEILTPESIAGVKARFTDSDWRLEYEGNSLNAGMLSQQSISPALCLPRLMSALRDGWLLEENEESWNDVPCLRICVDQSGALDGKILSTIWLREEDGIPLRGEIIVDGEVILTAEFTNFTFYDTIDSPTEDE